ncbi:MAG TPA: GNAT family N-acetyltransferase [Rhodanobacteraceae bacterium]|nr:GNAT family N-acetyltransferase [Rhodanobacteraceae bacterium]
MTTIRAARAYDASAIAELAGELGYPASRRQIATRLAGVEAETSARVIVAEDAEGRVIGWLHVAARAQLTEDSCAEILGLVVAERSRDAGIGAALVRAAEAWARSEGCAGIRVRSRDTRERAHRFYERHGFARVKSQLVLAKPLTDEATSK